MVSKDGSYNDSCRIWQRVWSLEKAVLADKRDWMKEGLACDPNLWMVLTTLPDDVELLLEARQNPQFSKAVSSHSILSQSAYELRETPPTIVLFNSPDGLLSKRSGTKLADSPKACH